MSYHSFKIVNQNWMWEDRNSRSHRGHQPALGKSAKQLITALNVWTKRSLPVSSPEPLPSLATERLSCPHLRLWIADRRLLQGRVNLPEPGSDNVLVIWRKDGCTVGLSGIQARLTSIKLSFYWNTLLRASWLEFFFLFLVKHNARIWFICVLFPVVFSPILSQAKGQFTLLTFSSSIILWFTHLRWFSLFWEPADS